MERSTGNPAPGFKQYPGHRVSARPAGVRVRVTLRGEVIADSTNAIALEEAMGGKTVAPVVYYLPRADVKMDRLVRSTHETHCPFKGQATYYSFRDGSENAVWSYETPYDEMRSIREMLAFYPDKVDAITAG
jgi:uncharacterized protein (DUF427 family)